MCLITDSYVLNDDRQLLAIYFIHPIMQSPRKEKTKEKEEIHLNSIEQPVKLREDEEKKNKEKTPLFEPVKILLSVAKHITICH